MVLRGDHHWVEHVRSTLRAFSYSRASWLVVSVVLGIFSLGVLTIVLSCLAIVPVTLALVALLGYMIFRPETLTVEVVSKLSVQDASHHSSGVDERVQLDAGVSSTEDDHLA